MALKRPPQHRVDARPVFVSQADEAWDKDRIDRECEAMEAAEEGSSVLHPAVKYMSYYSRGDLYAKYPVNGELACAADYLDLDEAWQHKVRRLGSEDFADVHARRLRAEKDGDDFCRAWVRSANLAFVGCEGPDCYKTVEEMHASAPGLVYELGEAAYYYSLPLTEDEKKA